MSTHLTDLLEGDPTVQKVLLIEADVSAGEDILTAAAELGVEAHVATHEDVFRSYRPELKAKISGTVFTDFADPQTALDDLARFCRETGIDGIVACWEFLSPLATRLADRLGLPGHRPELADACRNKRLMAEVFAAHGVPAPRTVVAQDPGELARRVAESGLGFPSSSNRRRTRHPSESRSYARPRNSPRPPGWPSRRPIRPRTVWPSTSRCWPRSTWTGTSSASSPSSSTARSTI